MIKVNLNKTKSSMTYDTQRAEVNPSGSVFSTAISTALKNIKSQSIFEMNTVIMMKFILNLIFILCFPLALKAYEIHQINKLTNEKVQKENLLSSINEELAKLETELKSYDYLQKKAEEFKKKKEFLKTLAEARLIIPRTIDLIQNRTPETVWLEHLKLELLETRQKVYISGKSFSETHVNFFANSLHDVLDKNSITVNTHDIREGDSVVRVNFSLQGVM